MWIWGCVGELLHQYAYTGYTQAHKRTHANTNTHTHTPVEDNRAHSFLQHLRPVAGGDTQRQCDNCGALRVGGHPVKRCVQSVSRSV